jgi:hypothetical protein
MKRGMATKTNAAWHAEHRMPAGPTLEERISWHIEHSMQCGCRPIPAKLQEEIRRRRARGGKRKATLSR